MSYTRASVGHFKCVNIVTCLPVPLFCMCDHKFFEGEVHKVEVKIIMNKISTTGNEAHCSERLPLSYFDVLQMSFQVYPAQDGVEDSTPLPSHIR